MRTWEKKDIAREVVKEIHDRYSCDPLTASVLARRGITKGSDILYYLEDDFRYLHNPFLFTQMEDAVDRIFAAVDESEKVLIFGDRDVDGVTSTTMLYEYLTELGLDVRYRIPMGDDAYGLSMAAVEAFASDYGSLIITVDCGINNNAEIARAAEHGIDVIVVDHHNPQSTVPEGAIIINPKVEGSPYPFTDLAGCGVVYKLITALNFAKTELYKEQICLLNVRPVNDAYVIEAIKTVNCIEVNRIAETVIPGLVSISQTRLLPFLQGQKIFVWDEALQKKQLAKIFGTGVEFNMFDIRNQIDSVLTGVARHSLIRLAPLSKIAHYMEKSPSELDGFFNLFVTFVLKKTALFSGKSEENLQLVMLATLADLMELKNENRILVRLGLHSLNTGKARSGLAELLSKQHLLGKKIGTTDIAWNITPVLNAAGRLGKPELAIQLFLEQDAIKKDAIAEEIVALNKERRELGSEVWPMAEKTARESLEKYGNNLVFVADGHIHRGVTGIIATKLAQYFKVPAVVITFLSDEAAVGSVRSVRGYNVTALLEQCADLFTNHGGHDFAAGFSLPRANTESFAARLETLARLIEFPQSEDEEPIEIDAELPHSYLTPDLLSLVDRFEPYGEGNKMLTFLAKNMKIIAADIMGRVEAKHLKLTLGGGTYKWPAVYWSAAEKLKTEFDIGDSVDVVFEVNRNTFNGNETAQMIVTDMRRSGTW